jgi:MFS family permease
VRVDEGELKWMDNLRTIYDRKTLFLIAMQYINEGGTAMIELACYLLFLNQEVEPAEAMYLMMIIMAPEVFSIFWGMLSDFVPIYGKRGHVLLASGLQVVGAIIVVSLPFDTPPYDFAICAMIMICGKAWLTPVIEGLMVNQMKRDPERGAEDLATFGLFMQSTGSIFYCICGGAIYTVNNGVENESVHPRYFFNLVLVVGLLLFLGGCIYPENSE